METKYFVYRLGPSWHMIPDCDVSLTNDDGIIFIEETSWHKRLAIDEYNENSLTFSTALKILKDRRLPQQAPVSINKI